MVAALTVLQAFLLCQELQLLPPFCWQNQRATSCKHAVYQQHGAQHPAPTDPCAQPDAVGHCGIAGQRNKRHISSRGMAGFLCLCGGMPKSAAFEPYK